MLEAPTPANEDARLEVLRVLELMDTEREERFDRVVEIAKLAFEVPIALITLLDTDRQWFKACIGLPISGTDRSVSFCGHAIHSDEPFIVEDALRDERFADNPLVLDAPFIRFYAGAPLIAAKGVRLGTLCVIDTEPRRFAADDAAVLRRLARIARDEMIRPPAPEPELFSAAEYRQRLAVWKRGLEPEGGR